MMSFIAKSSFSWKWKSDTTFSNNLQQKKDSERIAWSPSKEKLVIVKQIFLTGAIENIMDYSLGIIWSSRFVWLDSVYLPGQ